MGFLERCQSKKIDTSHYAQETPLAFMEITCTFVQEHRALTARVVPWVPEAFLMRSGQAARFSASILPDASEKNLWYPGY